MKTLHSYENVPDCIRNFETFQTRERRAMDDGSLIRHLIGEWRGDVYVVYSYGAHYPMFLYDKEAETWYVNNEKSSKTTERHKWKFRPDNMHYASKAEMNRLIRDNGILGRAKRIMTADF